MIHLERATLKSCAKINLDLAVMGKLPNNYHLIRSRIGFIDLYDQIEVYPQEEGLTVEFESHSLTVIVQEELRFKSTITQAFGMLQSRGYNFSGHLQVQKNIPLASGLGGGSSNAGALLLYLKDNYKVPSEIISEIAIKIGADVPMFLHSPQAMLIEGIGDKVTLLPSNEELRGLFIILVRPNSGILFNKTAKVFSKVVAPVDRPMFIEQSLPQMTNDLTEAASYYFPQLLFNLEILRKLEGALCARMTGAGPSCFALFAEEVLAIEALEKLPDLLGADCSYQICRFIC